TQCDEVVDVWRVGGELYVKPREGFVHAAWQSCIKVATGVLAERGGHLQRAFAGTRRRNVTAERHHFAVLVADLGPALAELFDIACFKILGKENVRIALDAGVPRIFRGETICVSAEVTRRGVFLSCGICLLTSAATIIIRTKLGQAFLRNPINP